MTIRCLQFYCIVPFSLLSSAVIIVCVNMLRLLRLQVEAEQTLAADRARSAAAAAALDARLAAAEVLLFGHKKS